MAFVRLASCRSVSVLSAFRHDSLSCVRARKSFLLGDYRAISLKTKSEAVNAGVEKHTVGALSTQTTTDGGDLVSSSSGLDFIPPTTDLAACNLGGWTPVGLVQEALAYLHFGVDFSWWTAIVLAGVAARLLVFPVQAIAYRYAVRLHNCRPEKEALQLGVAKAARIGDFEKASERQKELLEFFRKQRTSPLKPFVGLPVVAPVFCSIFVALSQILSSNPPLAGLTNGGALWLSDLTIPDPFSILPLICCAGSLAAFELSAETGVKLEPRATVIVRMLCFPMFFAIDCFPAAFQLYWATHMWLSVGGALLLRSHAVGKLLGIPERIKHNKTRVIDDKGGTGRFMDDFRMSVQTALRREPTPESVKAAIHDKWLQKNQKDSDEYNRELKKEKKKLIEEEAMEDEMSMVAWSEDVKHWENAYETMDKREKRK